jgi:uncharacterized protein YyaL (SSP411 family)
MLYDNGQLMSLYAHAYQLTQNIFYKNIVSEIAEFIERDLSSPEGGFYSSLNADTKSGEGEFYAWTYSELKKIVEDKSAAEFFDYYNISPSGNWKENKNILFATYTPSEYAREKKISLHSLDSLLRSTKNSLLLTRNERSKPDTDDKILSSWNALMLKGYIDAYVALGKKSYLDKALSNARFIETKMIEKDGQLWRNYKDGKSSITGFLDDYALVAKAFIRLYQVTLDTHWLSISKQLTDYVLRYFYDNKSGMFYYTSSKSEQLVVRKIEISDNAIPSSNATMAEVLYNLSIYFENDDYLNKCSQMLSSISSQMNSQTAYYGQWCYLAGMFSYGTYEVAIMGKDALKKNLDMQKKYLPACLFMGETDEENLPLLESKLAPGKTLIYVCINKTCKLPVEEVTQALQQLNKNPLPAL